VDQTHFQTNSQDNYIISFMRADPHDLVTSSRSYLSSRGIKDEFQHLNFGRHIQTR
jgi:hypothetical protein